MGVREREASRVMPASLPENQGGGGRGGFTERGSLGEQQGWGSPDS